MEHSDHLNQIAQNYHLASLPDMHIEEACQLYELQWIKTKIGPSPKQILDLGYGDGINFKALLNDYAITLVEGSDSLCREAELFSKGKGPGSKVFCSMFEHFETDKKFDIILASHVLEHVDNPIALLTKLTQMLSKDGLLIGIVPNSESLHRRLGLAMGLQNQLDDLSARDHLVGHQRVYSFSTLCTALEESGLVVIEHRGFFLKVLANFQMIHLEKKVLDGLLKMSDSLATELCANIGFVCAMDESDRLSNLLRPNHE